MLDSSDGVAASASGVIRLAPHSLQNRAPTAFSSPQLGQCMVELPFLGSKLSTELMILLVWGRDKPSMPGHGMAGSEVGEDREIGSCQIKMVGLWLISLS